MTKFIKYVLCKLGIHYYVAGSKVIKKSTEIDIKYICKWCGKVTVRTYSIINR